MVFESDDNQTNQSNINDNEIPNASKNNEPKKNLEDPKIQYGNGLIKEV